MSALRNLLRPSKLLRRRALYQGLLGGSRGWLSVGMVMWVWGFLKRFFAGGDPLTRYMEELQPGERLVIAHPEPAPSRRKARKARRRERAALRQEALVSPPTKAEIKAQKKADKKALKKAEKKAEKKADKRGPRRMRVRRG